jgi:hypothetical protein
MPRRAGERPNPSHIWTGWRNLVHAANGSACADFIIARRSCKKCSMPVFYRAFPEAGRLLTPVDRSGRNAKCGAGEIPDLEGPKPRDRQYA